MVMFRNQMPQLVRFLAKVLVFIWARITEIMKEVTFLNSWSGKSPSTLIGLAYLGGYLILRGTMSLAGRVGLQTNPFLRGYFLGGIAV